MPPPPAKHETLENLFTQAAHFAEFAMRNLGSVPPTLFFLSGGELGVFMPQGLKDDKAKDDFALQARLVCVAHAVTAVVMVLEAWATFAKPDQPLDLTTPPSEAFDRREFVVLMGESRAGGEQRMLPIIRTDAGGFFGFGETERQPADQLSGRFAHLLPPKEPTEESRAQAKALLAQMGARVQDDSGADSGATGRGRRF